MWVLQCCGLSNQIAALVGEEIRIFGFDLVYGQPVIRKG